MSKIKSRLLGQQTCFDLTSKSKKSFRVVLRLRTDAVLHFVNLGTMSKVNRETVSRRTSVSTSLTLKFSLIFSANFPGFICYVGISDSQESESKASFVHTF